MFKYPYETTPCSSYVLKEIISALQHALVNGELRPAQTLRNTPVEGVSEVPPYVKAVPPFSHALAFDHFGREQLVVDTRPFVRQTMGGEIKVTSATEYQFAVIRAALARGWAKGDQSEFHAMGDMPMRAYIRWLSEGIVRRLGLNPQDQMALSAVTGYFYCCMFETASEFDERTRLKIAMRIARVTAIPVDKILQITDGLGVLQNVTDYCEAIKTAVASPRLEQFGPGLLYGIVSGSWFGAAAREIVAVAIEYPPTLFAMVYMALTDRSFHSAFFTKLVLAVDKGSAGKDFTANLVGYLEASSHV